jgi:hypothetical protein
MSTSLARASSFFRFQKIQEAPLFSRNTCTSQGGLGHIISRIIAWCEYSSTRSLHLKDCWKLLERIGTAGAEGREIKQKVSVLWRRVAQIDEFSARWIDQHSLDPPFFKGLGYSFSGHLNRRWSKGEERGRSIYVNSCLTPLL